MLWYGKTLFGNSAALTTRDVAGFARGSLTPASMPERGPVYSVEVHGILDCQH